MVTLCDEEGLSTSQEREELLLLSGGGSTELLIAAGYLREKLGEKMTEYVGRRFGSLKPTSTHILIAKLLVAGIVTTNYDPLIELGLQSQLGETPNVILHDDDYGLSRLDRSKPWILKIHGTHTKPGSVVLSFFDYENLPAAATAALSRMFQGYTVLFLGYGLGDPDILPMLSRIRSIFGGINRRHYALVDGTTIGNIAQRHLLAAYKIQAIPYKNISTTHGEVTHFIGRLVELQERAGHDEISKLLILITATRIHSNGSEEPVLLVTDGNPQWRIQTSATENTSQGAYLLPSLTRSPNVIRDPAQAIANFLNVEAREVEVQLSTEMHSTKPNPATGRKTRYIFQFAQVQLRANALAPDELKGRRYTWHTIMELRGHPATDQLNSDVFVEVSKRYGGNLESLPRSLSNPISVYSDPYSIRSERYALLPWVADDAVYQRIFGDVYLAGGRGVVELGCGPALLGRYVASVKGLPYAGFDSSAEMLKEARRTLDGIAGTEVHKANIVLDGSAKSHNGWLFVLKNVLHLVDTHHAMLSTLPARFGVPCELVVVETVCPSLDALAWVQVLFSQLGLNYKKHWFVRNQIQSILRTAGYQIVREEELEQYIDVNQWLDSFQIGAERQGTLEEFIRTAPDNVQRDMKISKSSEGGLQMLRLQSIVRALPPVATPICH